MRRQRQLSTSLIGHQVATEQAKQPRDLGILVEAEFKLTLQCQTVIKMAWRATYQLRMTVVSTRSNVCLPPLKGFARPQLEHYVQAWRPHLVGYTKIVEEIQFVFTRRF